MQISSNLKIFLLSIVIFFLPFVDFINNNIAEIDIIIGKSFYFLILLLALFLFFCSAVIKFFFKKKNIFEIFFIVTLVYWILFKHNLLTLAIKRVFDVNSELYQFSAELSLVILFMSSLVLSILIYKNNFFVKRFVSIFVSLSLFLAVYQIFDYKNEQVNTAYNEEDRIFYEDKLNNKKENIYFFILDGMQPIEDFEKNFDLDLEEFLDFANSKNYLYLNDTFNLYDNTSHGLSAIFYLNEIFDDNLKLKKSTSILYPTLLRKNNQSDLINNLNNLEYNFKWLGNFFAYCPKFNLRYCLNKNDDVVIDTYLYINFFRQSPLIQIVINFGYLFNFDYNKHFFYGLNDGIGRLIEFHENNDEFKDTPTFYFIHHMSPHWPYITDSDCSYKSFKGEKNYEGYRSAYLCVIKKIEQAINFFNKYDPNATIIFQSDHNWIMSRNKREKKKIFNLVKIDDDCNLDKSINYNNVNMLRLVLTCITGNNPKYVEN